MKARMISVLVIAVCVFGASPGLNLRAADVLTPEMVAGIRTVSDAVISPSGDRIAYTLSVPRMPGKDDDGTAWSELHVIRLDTAESVPFITGKGNVSSVSWTRDGRQISFLAKRGADKYTALYRIAVDGGEASKVVELKSNVLAYSWNPKGDKVALVAVEPEAEEIEKRREKGFRQVIYEEDWRHRRVYIVDLSRPEPKPQVLSLNGSVFELAWSPVDERLAVSLAPTPLVDDSYMYKRVHIVDSATGKILAKLENPGKLSEIEWSPDGKFIAMISGVDIHDPAAGRILVGLSAGGKLSEPLNGMRGDASDLVWLSGGTLAFINAEGVWTSVETVKADGSQRVRLAGPDGPIATGISSSADGKRFALVASAHTHPAEVFTLSSGESVLKRLTESNPSLRQLRLAPQEVVRHKARDGLELQGVLIRPLNEAPGQRYPTLLVVHGGPEAHISNGWLTTYSNLGQMAAARGFAVFYPNYRGSTGISVDFSKLGQADPAGKEFDDLADAVDHLVSVGLADKDKIGITGGSYGGYATAWCSTHYTERFAAGVMFVGISDKVSKVGTTDIPNEEYLVHARKRPWENWNFLLERSPVYHAGKSRTPLLILHGMDDPRVNVGQSRELYRHLKLHGKVPVRLVLYPGEEHGNRKAAARYDYCLRALGWFEHYLKGPGGDPPAPSMDYILLRQ